jgi:hypothetical protein
MSMDKVGGVAGATPAPALESGRERFAQVLEQVKGPKVAPEGALPQQPGRVEAAQGAQRAEGVERAAAGKAEVQAASRVDSVRSARAQQAVQVLERVGQAQKRLDHILQLAESGRSFSPAELLALQAHVYRASQELDLAGKVVEKATGGLKQVLQTQV